MMAVAAGVQVCGLWSVRPGLYERRETDLEHPEFLLVTRV